MTKPQHDAIPGFTSVAPSIWEFRPVLPFGPLLPSSALHAPSAIILFSWTGAQGRHISKYAMKYQSFFPTTPILVITTSAKDLCLRSSKRKQARLQPAVKQLSIYDDYSSILIHVFSEGGCNKAVEFAEAYHSYTGSRLPCTALCLDSTPGHPRYRRLCNALGKSLPPNPILKSTGLLLGSVFLGGVWVLFKCFFGTSNNVISMTRGRIMDESVWDISAPRCYLYSPADELIDWRDIREHISEAAERGVPTLDVCFKDSAHCKHAAEDPDWYWNSVMLTWRQSAMPHREGRC